MSEWTIKPMSEANHIKATELFLLISEACNKCHHSDPSALLIFAKQCSLASQEIERLLNEREPEVTKGK